MSELSQHLFLAMVLGAFATFIVVVGGVSTWIMLDNLRAETRAQRSRQPDATSASAWPQPSRG